MQASPPPPQTGRTLQRSTRFALLPVLVAIMACLIGPMASSAAAQAPSSPSPRDLLDATEKVYEGARTYQDAGVVIAVLAPKGGPQSFTETSFTTAFVRPDRFRFECTDTQAGSRHVLWRKGAAIRSWRTGSEETQPDSLITGLMGAFGTSRGVAAIVPLLLMPEEARGRLLTSLTELVRLPDLELADGHACYRIQGNLAGTTFVLWIDPMTKLIRRIEETADLGPLRIEQTMTYDPVLDQDVSDALLVAAIPGDDTSAAVAPDAAVPPSAEVPAQSVRVTQTVDPATGRTMRKVGSELVADDADLERQLTGLRDAARASGSRLSVIIDSTRDVPWADVVTVLNTCNVLKIGPVAFEIRDP